MELSLRPRPNYATSFRNRATAIGRHAVRQPGAVSCCNNNIGTQTSSSAGQQQELAAHHSSTLASYDTGAVLSQPALLRKLPAPITCAFPVCCHPHYDSVREECDRWSLSLFEPPSFLHDSSLRLAYFRGLKTPLLVASAYACPRISPHRLLLACKLSFWLFLLDDVIDEADAQTAAVVASGFLAVLTSTDSSSGTANSTAPLQYNTNDSRIQRFMERLRLEVWAEIRRDMSLDLQRRYVRECVRSIEAMKVAWRLRQALQGGITPAEPNVGAGGDAESASTMARRLLDGFCWPFTTLLEYALGVELPDPEGKTVMGSLVQKMVKAAGTQALCVNEVFSCGKELVRKDAQSMVAVLVAQRRAAAGGAGDIGDLLESAEIVEEIMGEVWKIVQEEENKCLSLLQEIRRLAREDDEAERVSLVYAEALADFIAGHLWWSTQTMRYNAGHPVPWNTSPCFLAVPTWSGHPLNFLCP